MKTLLPASRQVFLPADKGQVLSLDPQFMSLSMPLQLSQFCCLEGQAVFAKKEVAIYSPRLSPGAIKGIHPSVKLMEGRDVSAK